MRLSFTSKTTADCAEYLKVVYDNQEYTLSDFSEKFKETEFQLDSMLSSCEIIYKETKYTFDDYKERRLSFSNSLPLFTRYSDEILPMEIHLSISNFDYYKAAKFLEKAETCLQTARYYLMQGEDIIEYDCNLPWKYGYQLVFDIRTTNFTTAIIWYNNCFDYILQIAFLAFCLYKKMPRFRENMQFEEILKLCTFKSIRELHESNSDNQGLNELWIILKECHDSISDLNEWANYLKHKGGIGIVGLKPDSPFQIYIGKPGETPESRTSEFESIKLDLDESIIKTRDMHNSLICCLNRLVDFIGFENAKFSIDEEGRYVIPERNSYMKIDF